MPVSEEVSKTTQTVVAALKSTPMMLAVVIFNVMYMVGMFWSLHETSARFERLLNTAMQGCATEETTLTPPTPSPKQ